MKARFAVIDEVVIVGVIFALSMHVATTSTFHLTPTEPALAPFAHTLFCEKYPEDCKKSGKKNTVKVVALTPALRAELAKINSRVNDSIVPQAQPNDRATEQWLINPIAGDCNDYAVTKRHELIQKGWPVDALLLSEVELRSGEHHLVLVARTNEGDLVLDNLKSRVRSVAEAELEYKWIRMESSGNPKFWTRVKKSI